MGSETVPAVLPSRIREAVSRRLAQHNLGGITVHPSPRDLGGRHAPAGRCDSEIALRLEKFVNRQEGGDGLRVRPAS